MKAGMARGKIAMRLPVMESPSLGFVSRSRPGWLVSLGVGLPRPRPRPQLGGARLAFRPNEFRERDGLSASSGALLGRQKHCKTFKTTAQLPMRITFVILEDYFRAILARISEGPAGHMQVSGNS